jgi:hypothetical protein
MSARPTGTSVANSGSESTTSCQRANASSSIHHAATDIAAEGRLATGGNDQDAGKGQTLNGSEARRYLVLLIGTLAAPGLATELLLSQQPSSFHLVVPAPPLSTD